MSRTIANKPAANAPPFTTEEIERITDVVAQKLRSMDQANPNFHAALATLERYDPKRAEEFQAEMAAPQ